MNHAIYNYDGKVLWASVQVVNDSTLVGYRITNGWARANYTYFAMKFSKPFTNYGYVDHKKPKYMGHLAKFKPNRNFPTFRDAKSSAILTLIWRTIPPSRSK